MNTNAPEAEPKKITRADIEAKLGELGGEVEGRVEQVKISAAVVLTAVAVTAVVVAYWSGRRRAKRRQMVLEIRRI